MRGQGEHAGGAREPMQGCVVEAQEPLRWVTSAPTTGTPQGPMWNAHQNCSSRDERERLLSSSIALWLRVAPGGLFPATTHPSGLCMCKWPAVS